MKNRIHLWSFSSSSVALLLSALFVSWPQKAQACGEGAYMGQVCLTAANFCPINTMEASGGVLSINEFNALFSVLGCTYGGNCQTTFALPDLRGRAPVHYGKGATLPYYREVGQQYGSEQIVQTASQLAAHKHAAEFVPYGGATGVASGTVTLPVTASATIASSVAVNPSKTPTNHAVLGPATSPLVTVYSAPGTVRDVTIGPEGAVKGTATGKVTLPVTGEKSGGAVIVDNTGNSKPMDIVGPRLAMRYCIVVKGIYPPRG
ncbi:phage tail protein [Marinomonas spartinae]|uniref:phage tail protein n=1 Tax=Marinomonas spartinae TaxID=1792290 RepID=UPI0018F1AD3C|nr:tail fiber protein [Marinomonas spartinae]MBJ7553738.1 tail fiber protein [Marinomonas spartinae]